MRSPNGRGFSKKNGLVQWKDESLLAHNINISICVHIILNGMVIFMINNFLKEVVKLPRHQEPNDDCKTLFGECSLEFHGLCDFEDKLQVAPCIGCPHHR